jgi:uncharacterized membrane protein
VLRNEIVSATLDRNTQSDTGVMLQSDRHVQNVGKNVNRSIQANQQIDKVNENASMTKCEKECIAAAIELCLLKAKTSEGLGER